MTNTEYRKFRQHILDHMETVENLGNELDRYKTTIPEANTTWNAAQVMCQYGIFDVYYDDVMETLRDVYGDKFDESKYLTKDGQYRFKNNEAYCWTVYKAKLAKTIEIMEKKGEI